MLDKAYLELQNIEHKRRSIPQYNSTEREKALEEKFKNLCKIISDRKSV